MPGLSLFWPGHSLWHDLDPRSKSVALLLFCLLLMQTGSSRTLAVLMIMAVAAGASSRIPAGVYWKNLRGFLLLIGLTMIVQAWSSWDLAAAAPVSFQPAAALLTAVGFQPVIDYKALETGLALGARIMAMVLAALLFSMTTSPAKLIEASGKVLRPFKRIGLPVEDLQMVMYIAYRFLPLLLLEGQVIREAQLSRGIDFQSGSVVRRWQKRLALVIPLLNRALSGAEQLAESMEARGYEPGQQRASQGGHRLGTGDYILIVLSLLAFGGMSLL